MLLSAAILAAFCPPARAQDAQALHAQGVAAARSGQLSEGAALLEHALRTAPDDRGVLADLVVVLSWAGQDRAALARFNTLGENAAPGYALAAAAVSARRLGRARQAVRLYRRALERGETGLETRLGLALSHAALGEFTRARKILAEAASDAPGNPRLRAVAAEVERMARPDPAKAAAHPPGHGDPAAAAGLAAELLAQRHPFDALRLLEPALSRTPTNSALRRQEILALAAVGAPALALTRAASFPQLLTPPERRRIEGDAHAFLVRWGSQIEAPNARDPAARHARTDAAIAALDEAILAWEPLGPEARDARRNARLDRLIALRDRGRMQEVVEEAASLRSEAPLPAYARSAVGDALLSLRQPEAAEAEYRAVLREEPGALTPSLGLFYALTEQRRWPEARAIADRLERDTPPYRPVRGPGAPEPNWDRIDALRAGILWHMWGDDYATAEPLAGSLATEAPRNASLRALRGDIWRLRGWPAKALEEYETALTDDPDALDLRLGRVQALWDIRRWREAEAEAGRLRSEYPESTAVRRLLRSQELWRMREVEVTSRAGLERGSRDPELDLGVRLWSAPIGYHWRAFSGAALRTGDTNSGALTTYRLLAGLEWRGEDAVVSGGVTLDQKGVSRGGAFATGTLRLSDHWSIEGGLEATASDTPLQALRRGIWADAAGLGVTWRPSDLREVAASVRVMAFSDGNDRLIGFGRWQERVMNRPDWKLDLQPYVYATRNSERDAFYFNPERDLEAGASGILHWTAWQRYERDLRLRASVTAGGYWQEGYGWSPVLAAQLQNAHSLSDRLHLTYGIGWARRDYDGRSQDSLSAIGALRWRF